jgi:hypothetical protein
MTDTPYTQKVQVVNLGKPWHHAYKELYSHACEQEKEIAKLREEKQWLRETLSDEAKNYFDIAQVRLPELLRENAKLREALKEISTTAHCIAKAGPLNTPTLQDAWGKFMAIDAMATKALSK